jgi:hypothetical protein
MYVCMYVICMYIPGSSTSRDMMGSSNSLSVVGVSMGMGISMGLIRHRKGISISMV